MPSPSVKALIKRLSNHLSKVCAVRSKRPTKNRRTQRSSTTYHEGHDSISADIPIVHPGSPAGDPSLGFSTNISSAAASHGNSVTRTICDVVQTVGPFAQGVASAIPVVGSPLQAAISGLLSILQIVDRCSQNKAELKRLMTRLRRLSSYLCNAQSSQDPSEQARRNAIMEMLLDMHAKVTQLRNRSLVYASVTQDIIACTSEIDDYLADYWFSSQMQTQHDIYELRKNQEEQREMWMGIASMVFNGRSSVGPIVTLGFVTLVDATARSHTIPMDVCDSFERFNEQLQLLFKHNSNRAQIQRRYMEQGQYDLCIDDEKQVIQLTRHQWPRIEAGTTIVMRVIFEQETQPKFEYQCHVCGAVNSSRAEHLQAGCSIDCRVCKRRFQISRGNSTKRKTQSYIDYIRGSEAEMHLIHNFHVQQTAPSRSQKERFLKEFRRFRRERLESLRLSRPVNVAAYDFAGSASAMSHSHSNEILRNGSTQPSHVSPSHDGYAYNRI